MFRVVAPGCLRVAEGLGVDQGRHGLRRELTLLQVDDSGWGGLSIESVQKMIPPELVPEAGVIASSSWVFSRAAASRWGW